jgi:two-component system, chemotaxis family, protein-glutamate methylesterase/glutaminase
VERVVVIGASAGGLEALVSIAKALPGELSAAVFVVLHSAPRSDGLLPQILGRSGALPAAYAQDREPIEPGRIYVAPSDMHMLIGADTVQLSHTAKENGFRPAVDPLFRSAADCYEERAIGVVLSGGLADGAAGLRAIKKRGGFAIVQDPEEAPFQSMPASALEMGPVDLTLPAKQIGTAISRVVRLRVLPTVSPAADDVLNFGRHAGTPPSTMTCPECHGMLWEVDNEFRCRVGHSFSVSRLVEAQDEELERALWAAVRSMEESGSLSRRLAEGAGLRNQASTAQHFLARAREKEEHAAVLRKVLTGKGGKAEQREARQISASGSGAAD